ncbi:MAG: hypothetical protein WC506_02845 [Candidatus Micrarchaeia archaeon]
MAKQARLFLAAAVAIAAILAAMAPAIFAQQGIRASGFVEAAISGTVPISQTFQIAGSADLGNRTAYFVRTSDDQQYVFVHETEGGIERVYLSDDPALLGQAYRAVSQESGGRPFNASVAAQMPALILEMNSTRGEEAVCRQYSGNTNGVCHTREGCQKNCRSSPLCLGLAESSWDFFEAIAQFNNDVSGLDAEVAQDPHYYSALAANATPETIDNYLAHVSRIIVLASNVSATRLNTDYGFCPVPPFDLTKILVQRDRVWEERKETDGYMRAGDMAAQSAAAAEKLKQETGASGVFERQAISVSAQQGDEAISGISGWLARLAYAFFPIAGMPAQAQ